MDWREDPAEAKKRLEKMINLLTCLYETREDLVNETMSPLREKIKIMNTFLGGVTNTPENQEELKKYLKGGK